MGRADHACCLGYIDLRPRYRDLSARHRRESLRIVDLPYHGGSALGARTNGTLSMNDRRGRGNGQKNESRAVRSEVKSLCGERKAESAQQRMKDSNLVRPGGKTVDPEFPKGISDGHGLRSLDQHFGARQKT